MVYDKGGMSVFKRTYQEETTIIALNNTKKTQKVHLTREQLDTNKELHGLMEEDIIRPAKDGYYLVLDRETANVYALAEKTGLNIPFISVLVGINVLFVIFLILVKRRRKKS
jgi:alpha-amylase